MGMLQHVSLFVFSTQQLSGLRAPKLPLGFVSSWRPRESSSKKDGISAPLDWAECAPGPFSCGSQCGTSSHPAALFLVAVTVSFRRVLNQGAHSKASAVTRVVLMPTTLENTGEHAAAQGKQLVD